MCGRARAASAAEVRTACGEVRRARGPTTTTTTTTTSGTGGDTAAASPRADEAAASPSSSTQSPPAATNDDVAWEDEEKYRAFPNAHPGQPVAVLVKDRDTKVDVRPRTMTWGLVPSWSDSARDHWKLFNARSETAHSLGVFKKLYFAASGRGVAVLAGFYEWVDAGPAASEKQAHFVKRADGRPLLVAALCDASSPKFDHATCTLLTRDVVPSLAWLHDRMPVIFNDARDARRWLDEPDAKVEFGDPPPLATHMVTRKMNKMSYQEDDASAPVKPPKKLTAFFAPAVSRTKVDAKASSRSAATEPKTTTPSSSSEVVTTTKTEVVVGTKRKAPPTEASAASTQPSPKSERKPALSRDAASSSKGASPSPKKKTKQTAASPSGRSSAAITSFFKPVPK